MTLGADEIRLKRNLLVLQRVFVRSFMLLGLLFIILPEVEPFWNDNS
jgi:hypothetical protein